MSNQNIPYELMLNAVGQQVKVDIDAHRKKLEAEIAKRQARLRELHRRRAELMSLGQDDTENDDELLATLSEPVSSDAPEPPPLNQADMELGDDDFLFDDDDELLATQSEPVSSETPEPPPLNQPDVELGDDDFLFGDDDELLATPSDDTSAVDGSESSTPETELRARESIVKDAPMTTIENLVEDLADFAAGEGDSE